LPEDAASVDKNMKDHRYCTTMIRCNLTPKRDGASLHARNRSHTVYHL